MTIPSRQFVEAMVLRTLKTSGHYGYTVREFLLDMPVSHHGQASGAFSDLHRAGRIECLSERRNGYCVYVLPRYAKGKKTRQHASVKREERREELLTKADNVEDVLGDGYSVALIENLHALLAEIDKQFR